MRFVHHLYHEHKRCPFFNVPFQFDGEWPGTRNRGSEAEVPSHWLTLVRASWLSSWEKKHQTTLIPNSSDCWLEKSLALGVLFFPWNLLLLCKTGQAVGYSKPRQWFWRVNLFQEWRHGARKPIYPMDQIIIFPIQIATITKLNHHNGH